MYLTSLINSLSVKLWYPAIKIVNGCFIPNNANFLPGIYEAALGSADIDSDGDQDLIIAGGSYSLPRTHLFKNITGQLSISDSQPSEDKYFKI